jgi:phosphoribosyl 1,2-cyclic phosphodiesterase
MRCWTILHGVGNAWPELCPDPYCPLCAGSDRPIDGRGQTSVSLVGGEPRAPELHVVIDAGAGLWQGLRRAGLPLPGLVLITHAHVDHASPGELDVLARAARDVLGTGERLRLMTSRETWTRLPEVQRQKFAFVPIEAGESQKVQLGDALVEVAALGAADHFPGTLNYVLSVPDFRLGALFDRKSWNGVDRDRLDNLDLAVIEANTLRPMSERTKHVSVVEDLAFLASLDRPPRLALLTHYGHDDRERYSLGSLEVLLAGLAPHLAVRVARKGMTVRSDLLPPRNPVAVLDETTWQVIGVADKTEVHARGLLHAAVLLLVRDGDRPGHVFVYERHARQSYPGRLDCFGGHMAPADAGDPRRAALREGREEVRPFHGGFAVAWPGSWLVPLSDPFELPPAGEHNRELATVFGVALPPGLELRGVDEVGHGIEVPLEVRSVALEELRQVSREKPDRFADGLGRILRRLDASAAFCRRVEAFLRGGGVQ